MPEPSLAKTFHALADAKRLRILEVLRSGECCVCDLAGSLDIRQSLLSFHLRTLRDAWRSLRGTYAADGEPGAAGTEAGDGPERVRLRCSKTDNS